jgi:hypothetical protein
VAAIRSSGPLAEAVGGLAIRLCKIRPGGPTEAASGSRQLSNLALLSFGKKRDGAAGALADLVAEP